MSNLEEQDRKKLKFSHGGDEGGEKKNAHEDNPIPPPQEDHINYQVLGNVNVVSSSTDVLKLDEARTKRYQSLKPEILGNSEFNAILSNFNVLTGEKHRDKWLERLLQGICNLRDHSETKEDIGMLPWPDAFVPAVVALEKAAHDTLSSDFHKYNQKMRHLFFNLKKYGFLAQRFLMGELEPSQLLNMSPNELKEGFAAEEYAKEQTEEPNSFQMTDANCGRCAEKRVGVIDIIQTGHSERYQLECVSCGNTWYAPRDEVSTLTIESPRAVGDVGTAPLATAKFEDVERKL